MTAAHPRILLLQAREPEDPARHDERRSFAEKAGLPIGAIVPLDLLSGPPTLRQIKAHDAVMVGGSGEYYVSKRDLPGFIHLMEVLAEVVDIGYPMFASCFGFQCLVQALGGEIVYDPDTMEVGTFQITLTDAGQADPLFSEMPKTFGAQVGRKDRAARLPDVAVHLASSEQCPYHAFRIPGKPIWATQFHPELTGEENLARYKIYLDGYAPVMTPEELQKTFERFGESPETKPLIPRFLKLAFG